MSSLFGVRAAKHYERRYSVSTGVGSPGATVVALANLVDRRGGSTRGAGRVANTMRGAITVGVRGDRLRGCPILGGGCVVATLGNGCGTIGGGAVLW